MCDTMFCEYLSLLYNYVMVIVISSISSISSYCSANCGGGGCSSW